MSSEFRCGFFWVKSVILNFEKMTSDSVLVTLRLQHPISTFQWSNEMKLSLWLVESFSNQHILPTTQLFVLLFLNVFNTYMLFYSTCLHMYRQVPPPPRRNISRERSTRWARPCDAARAGFWFGFWWETGAKHGKKNHGRMEGSMKHQTNPWKRSEKLWKKSNNINEIICFWKMKVSSEVCSWHRGQDLGMDLKDGAAQRQKFWYFFVSKRWMS